MKRLGAGRSLRLGVGIGLTDAERIAEEHGGDVTIESVQASSHLYAVDESIYKRKPFLTTVTLRIPLHV